MADRDRIRQNIYNDRNINHDEMKRILSIIQKIMGLKKRELIDYAEPLVKKEVKRESG